MLVRQPFLAAIQLHFFHAQMTKSSQRPALINHLNVKRLGLGGNKIETC